MTQEEIDLLRDLSAPLVENPLAWSALSSDQQSAFRLLMPDADTGFTDDQREWVNLWWLPVSQQEADDLNALCPENTVVAPREDSNGDLFINVDLLSDALDGGRLAALLPILETLPLTYKPLEEWPVPPQDEL